MAYGYNNQYSTTTYGAQGGEGGGGFLNQGGSQNSPGNSTKEHAKVTLRPVTIKQILDSQLPHPDADNFKIDGTEATQITFVAQIRNISTQTTFITYKMDDGTGTIEVRRWSDADANNAMDTSDGTKPRLVENAYARVWGRLRSYGNKRQIVCQAIKPIADYNEIQHHLLEATVVHLYYTRGPPDSGSKGPANAGQGMNQTNQYGGSTNEVVTATGKRLAPDTSAAAQKVFNILETSPQSNEGLHMQDIAVRLGMDVAEVGKAGDELLQRGYIYTTVDDFTWTILDI